jgi:AcrR family transcriptional regulator
VPETTSPAGTGIAGRAGAATTTRATPATTARATAATPTRERILQATLRVIAEDGLDAVTHRAVAARAGVSPGSTTHHFSSRDDLVRESFRYYLREGEVAIRELLADAPAGIDPIPLVQQRLAAMVAREFTHGLVRAEYELLLHAVADAELAAEVRAWEARMVAVFAESLEAAGVARPMRSARTLLNLVRGYELESLLDPSLTVADFEERLAPVLTALAVRA